MILRTVTVLGVVGLSIAVQLIIGTIIGQRLRRLNPPIEPLAGADLHTTRHRPA